MGLRVRRTAAEAGVEAGDLDVLEAIHGAAMAARAAALGGERDPLFLHPGRAALILLLDTATSDAATLSAALMLDTRRRDLQPGPSAVHAAVAGLAGGEALAGAALALRDAVPDPDDPSLAERLVVAGAAVRLVALAERLDHLRHLHLLDDGHGARRAWERAVEVYRPVADRTHPVMARRYAWWCRTFARRRG